MTPILTLLQLMSLAAVTLMWIVLTLVGILKVDGICYIAPPWSTNAFRPKHAIPLKAYIPPQYQNPG